MSMLPQVIISIMAVLACSVCSAGENNTGGGMHGAVDQGVQLSAEIVSGVSGANRSIIIVRVKNVGNQPVKVDKRLVGLLRLYYFDKDGKEIALIHRAAADGAEKGTFDFGDLAPNQEMVKEIPFGGRDYYVAVSRRLDEGDVPTAITASVVEAAVPALGDLAKVVVMFGNVDDQSIVLCRKYGVEGLYKGLAIVRVQAQAMSSNPPPPLPK